MTLTVEEASLITELKLCAKKRDLCKGLLLHVLILKRGLLETTLLVANTLLSMYAKCGALARAQGVLDELPARDVVSWSVLIAGYAQHGHGWNALTCFERMQDEGVSPDPMTFSCTLKACGAIGASDKGEEIYHEIAKQGLLAEDLVLGNAVVDMYAKCGAFVKAEEVLEGLHARDVVSWSTLITGYAVQGQGQEALRCFGRMQSEGICADMVTFISLLKACATIRALNEGKQIHKMIDEEGLLKNDVVLGSSLVDMYAKCGDLAKARQVLEGLSARNVVSWSAMIAGYAQHGKSEDAMDCYEQMKLEGISPNDVTLISTLKACGSLGSIKKGEYVHNEMARWGRIGDNIALGTALVDMYVKCGALAEAHCVLEDLPSCDVICWNALLGGYAGQGHGEVALSCFELMLRKGIVPDELTFTCILRACGSIGACSHGKQIHHEIVRQGLSGSCGELGGALVDMYTKCGELSKSQRLLEELPFEEATSWSALIAGYAREGRCRDALSCIDRMHHKGLAPNAVTFSCVLNACSHAGLVQEGEVSFSIMSIEYGIMPETEHYVCMVDLFGRAGHFDKAVALIERMPCSDHLAVWSALLGACRQWGEFTVGRWAFEHAMQVDRSDATFYIDMTNLYISAGMHRDAERIEAMRIQNRARHVLESA